MLPSEDGARPIVLLLGAVILAETEWEGLGAIADLRVSARKRNEVQDN